MNDRGLAHCQRKIEPGRCGGEHRHAGVGALAFLAQDLEEDHAHRDGDDQREGGDADEYDIHWRCPWGYRSLNSTAISTMTSTGVPYRRAGENRHCLTASVAR